MVYYNQTSLFFVLGCDFQVRTASFREGIALKMRLVKRILCLDNDHFQSSVSNFGGASEHLEVSTRLHMFLFFGDLELALAFEAHRNCGVCADIVK